MTTSSAATTLKRLLPDGELEHGFEFHWGHQLIKLDSLGWTNHTHSKFLSNEQIDIQAYNIACGMQLRQLIGNFTIFTDLAATVLLIAFSSVVPFSHTWTRFGPAISGLYPS